MHLRGGCDVEGRPLEVRHIAEIIADRLDEISVDNRTEGSEPCHCVSYRLSGEGSPRNQGKLGLIVGDNRHRFAAAGGPERLANALELSLADLKTSLDSIAGSEGSPLESV